MTFDDSYTLYVNETDFFKVVFCKYFTKETTLSKKYFKMTCTLRGKNDVQMTFDYS